MTGEAERGHAAAPGRRLVGALRDAHALQQHAEAALSGLLTAAADEPELSRPLGHYAERSRAYTRAVEARLRAHGASPGVVREAGTLLASVLEGGIGHGRRDPVRHMRDAYVAVHLQIAAGETLRRVADRAGDARTAAAAAAMCEDAHAMSHELSDRWDIAVDMTVDTTADTAADTAVHAGVDLSSDTGVGGAAGTGGDAARRVRGGPRAPLAGEER